MSLFLPGRVVVFDYGEVISRTPHASRDALVDATGIPADELPSPTAGISLGDKEVRPVDMASAFATFAADGPQQCSGLDVARWDADSLAEALTGDAFEVVTSERHVHHTPWDAEQPFTWLVLRRL